MLSFEKKFKNLLQTIESIKVYDRPSLFYNGAPLNPDAIVVFGDTPVAIVEYSQSFNLVDSSKRIAGEFLHICKCPIAIVVVNEQFFARELSGARFKELDEGALLKLIRRHIGLLSKRPTLAECKEIITRTLKNSPDFPHKSRLQEFLVSVCDRLVINDGQISFTPDDEDMVLRTILGDTKIPNQVCRYTSLENLFTSLDNQSQSMCSMRSMNDAQEGYYADSLLNMRFRYIPRDEEIIERDNNCFLLSCTPIKKSDNLTMWRLYGDNAKGVSIAYDVIPEKLDNKRFIVAPVCYGKNDAEHAELQFLSSLINSEVKNGWFFVLNRWFIWRYFFKSHSYKDESEIRMIFMPDEDDTDTLKFKWYQDKSNGIYNRMVLFPLSGGSQTFPLSLKHIILGPNSPEARVNREQILFMVGNKGIMTSPGFTVQKSVLKGYRK